MKITILGAGLVGGPMARDLAARGVVYRQKVEPIEGR
jgi:Trk K+ transport system NAD-binding subunit